MPLSDLLACTPILILVTGPPAGGKTTLARRLAADLELPLIEKDLLKEALFDTLGIGDVAWSQRLGGAVYEMLYRLAEVFVSAGTTVLLESNFVTERAAPRFREIAARHPFRAVQLVCIADPATLARRYEERAATGERHAGHHDVARPATPPEHWLQRHGPLDLDGVTIEVDTSVATEVDYVAVLSAVRLAIADESATPDATR
jgi:predicted kinase